MIMAAFLAAVADPTSRAPQGQRNTQATVTSPQTKHMETHNEWRDGSSCLIKLVASSISESSSRAAADRIKLPLL
tara:strand:- start:62848 stop:63072 length:225 start_codon:yes stop_codon:yes gene_type:complete